ncbi:MAG: sodium:alanine symporter family protein [Bacteroidetes bacterium]|nr:MAG: sodium:alanine symporter family protein [Bacteroidota bacterium]PIE87913.1 MAG: sodium:alanine symporter family protein [Bacteroidota bacterium]
MQHLNDILTTLDSYLGGAQWFVFLLLGTGLFFTIYLGFPQFRFMKHAIRIVRGKYDKKGDSGDTSHFQALTTALSGTVGTGNIAGVALAIHLGGPAAMFWMILTAAIGMCTKFVEVTLSHKYREFAKDGSVSGGPMYYMKNKLKMPWLAAIFSVATIICTFGTGSLPQINSISNAMYATFGIKHILTGAVLSVLLGFVILGGIKRIAKVTERLVPAMALVYLFGAFAVIITNYQNILPSLQAIITDIFTGTSATGGFLGAGFAFAFNRGVNRGLYSNEAGQGSAAIAHASARTKEPVSEGLVALLEPFIDTIIICTITGLVLLSSGVWKEKHLNTFQMTDMVILAHTVNEKDPADQALLSDHIRGTKKLPLFTGMLKIKEGKIQHELSILHARSVAEEVLIYKHKEPFTGTLAVAEGKFKKWNSSLHMEGKSLLHSAPLTTLAFTKSFLGGWGKFIVSIGLLLFAFSTAISWSYYGGRAVTYLAGVRYVPYYRIIYILMFFLASFIDTTLIWTFSGIAIVFMALPNLFGILMLHKDMKLTLQAYWVRFKREHPEEKIPVRIEEP